MNPMSKPVHVRFAPSPTGYLHVGGARTALFNYLFAQPVFDSCRFIKQLNAIISISCTFSVKCCSAYKIRG